MSKIAIITQAEFTDLFNNLGLVAYSFKENDNLKDKLEQIKKDDIAIIFIQEDLIKEEDIVEPRKDRIYPLIMPLRIYKDRLNLNKKMLSKASLKVSGKEGA